jgi:hypothetical protein
MRLAARLRTALRVLAGQPVELAVAADVDMHVEPDQQVAHKAIKPQAFTLRHPRTVKPTDELVLRAHGADVTNGGVPIERAMTVDRAVIWRFDDDLGFKHAVACAFGESGEAGSTHYETGPSLD